MVEALLQEMRLQAAEGFMGTSVINTIYLGGGTPSLLTGNEVALLLHQVHRLWQVQPDAEITLEANPDDVTNASLAAWKAAGVNRLSLGLQSLHAAELEWMNRAHTAEQSLQAIHRCRAAGFERLNVDLIYGSPLLSDAAWLQTLQWAVAQQIEHLSCYALTVEPQTPLEKFIRTGKRAGIVAEQQARQFELLVQTLTAAGYQHYEISNFALPGHESRHNSSYWQGLPYLGIGPSAHSYNGYQRRWNVAHNQKYLQAIERNKIPYEEETLTPVQQLNEYIMISLRRASGCDLQQVEQQFGPQRLEQLLQQAQKHIGRGHLQQSANRLLLTQAGKLFADGIAADLFFEA